mmetsp:Transcript_65632/g.77146  ORF Transcript_65632/g.77146 Transcript_65632/m.77146 type:complete len:83 (+) Transcript_65632:287-535(+)
MSLMSLFIGFKGDTAECKLPKHNRWMFLPRRITMLISSGTMPHSQSSNREGPNDTVDVPFPVACTSFSSVKNPTFAQRHLQK